MLPISLRVGTKNREKMKVTKRGGGNKFKVQLLYTCSLMYVEVSVYKRGRIERKEGRKERQRNVKRNLEGKLWWDIRRYHLRKQL